MRTQWREGIRVLKKFAVVLLVGFFSNLGRAQAATPLNPFFTFIGSQTLSVSWNYIGPTVQYTYALSDVSTFSTIFSSETSYSTNRTYSFLNPCTTYYFKVKVSTESDAGYNTPISTKTFCAVSLGALGFSANQNQIVKINEDSAYDAQGTYTIEFWFKRLVAAAPTSAQHLVGKENTTKSSGWAIVLQLDGTIRFSPFGAGGGLTSIRTFYDTNWHHVSLTKNLGSGLSKMYLDGVLDASANPSIPTPATTFPLKFGNSQDLSGDFEGELDEVRIWNVERTEGEINCSRKLSLNGNEPNLVGYWNLNENAGQIVQGRGSVPNNGVLGNSSAVEGTDPYWTTPSIPNFGTSCDSFPPLGAILNPVNSTTTVISSLNLLSGTAQDYESGLQDVKIVLKRLSDNYYWNRTGFYWSATPYENYSDGMSSWTFPGTNVLWSVGGYRLEVKIKDNDLNTTTLVSTFTVAADTEGVPPAVSINSHFSSTTYSSSQLTYMNGTASDNVSLSQVKIQFIRLSDNMEWDNTTVTWMAGPRFTNANGLDSWNFTMPVSAWAQNGQYTMVAKAIDQAGNQTSQSITFTVSSSSSGYDSISPTVSIQHPVNRSTQSPAALSSLSGTANDNNGYVEVSLSVKDINTNFYWNGSTFTSASEMYFYPPTSSNWNYGGIPQASWTDGHQYQLNARARDTAYNYAYAVASFTVNASLNADTVAPYLNIDTPVDGASYTPTTLTINGNAGDNIGVTRVQVSIRNNNSALFYDGNGFNSVAQMYLNAAGQGNWNFYLPSVALSNGSYLLQARAEDNAANQSSQQVTFSITGASTTSDTTSPTASILFPVNNSSFTSASSLTNLSGTCSDNQQVLDARVYLRDDNNKYYDGGSWNGTSPVYQYVQTGLNWFTTMPVGAWKNGSFTIFFDCRDNANNLTTISNVFTITGISGNGAADTVAPQITVYNPYTAASGTPYTFTSFSGRADDAFGIGQVVFNLRKGALYFDGAGFNSTGKVVLYPTLSNNTASSVDWSYNLVGAYVYTDGSYTLEIEATDPSANKQTQSVNFTVTGAGQSGGDINPPSVSIISFANNATKTAYDMTIISGTASDDVGLDKVELEIIRNSDQKWWSGSSWQTTVSRLTAASLLNWSLTLPLSMWSDGAYIVKAIAKDLSAKETQASNNLTISGSGTTQTPPTVTITNVQPGQVYTPAALAQFNGTSNGQTVRARVTDLNLNMNWDPVRFMWVTETIWSNAPLAASIWSSTNSPTYWPNGHFKISAEATGSSGLISTAEVDFYVSAYSSGTADFTSPAAIQDLAAQPGTTAGSIRLAWTSTGDDGNTGTAAGVTIKYSQTSPISTEATWLTAQDISLPPVSQTPEAPAVAGSTRNLTINNLTAGVNYFWAIRARDEAFNVSPLSNSPSAVAFGGCQAGSGDGQGTVTLSPNSLPASSDRTLTLTFTVGSSGITNGGKILFRVPDGWAYPQSSAPNMSGYFSAVSSKGSVTLTRETDGQMMKLLVNGTLTAGDTVTLTFLARSYSCTLETGIRFRVLSQANSCGIPTEIASQPTIDIIAGGNASWLGFDNYEKFVQAGQIATLTVRGQNTCGTTAAVGSNVNIQVAAVVRDPVTYTYTNDTQAVLSLSSTLSSSFVDGPVTMNNGQSTLNIYYKLNSNDGREHKVRIRYLDMQSQSYTSENTLNVIPVATGQGISNVSIDKGPVGANTTVTFSPPTETAYINYQTAQNISSVVKIMKNSQIVHELWGYGTPVRVAWNGDRSFPNFGTAAAGTYDIVIEAAGQQDTSLHAMLQTVGISGVVLNSSNTTIANANVNIFGPATRFTQTDSSGTFSFSGVSNGQYSLRIDKNGYETKEVTFSFNGTDLNLGNIQMTSLSKIIVNLTRTNSSSDLWGSVRTIDSSTQQEIWTSVHFAYGRTTADNGYNADKPEILLRPGVAYQLRLDLPGFTLNPLSKTLTNGEVYTWTASLTAKKGVSGTIVLGNGIANPTGLWVYINAMRGTDTYPTKFASAYIGPGGFQTTYSLLDLDAGSYTINFDVQGLSRESVAMTMAGADITQNITLTQGGAATLNVSFQGDTTGLDMKDGVADGLFPMTVRYTDNQMNGSKTIYLNTHATLSSAAKTVTGVRNGNYSIFYDKIDGFSLTTTSPQTLAVSGGVGSLSSVFVRDSGILRGTVSLPSGSSMAGTNFYLFREGTYLTAPVITGNQFEFRNLGSGKYSLSIYEPITGASKFLDVFIANGKTTDLSVNLNTVRTFSVSGTIRTVAAPPYDTLASINSQGSLVTYYTVVGTITAAPLRVRAQLINPDGSVDLPPTSANRILDPAKFKYSVVNLTNGTYQIDGLEEGKRYRLELNSDLNNDGKADIPRNDMMVSPTANISGADFTIRDGGKIQLALTSPNSESGYSLTLSLLDADRNATIQSQAISLIGTSANIEFPSLQIGRYIVSVADNNSPVKYTSKPLFVSLENITDAKSASLTLSEAGRVQLTLANRYGTLITSSNESTLLPQGFKMKLTNRSQILFASLDSGDGKYKAPIIPGVEYKVIIEPPAETTESDRGKMFEPVQLNAIINKSGEVLDLGVVVLKAGEDIAGLVKDENGNAIARIPVLAYQSMAKNIPPLQTSTNEQGKFSFNLSKSVRYYDFIANPSGNANSASAWSEEKATVIDITKPGLSEVAITLKAVTGGIKGQIKPAAGATLTAAYGDRAGEPGASLLVSINGESKTREFIANPDGRFDIALPGGRTCTLEILAANHSPKQLRNVNIPTDKSSDLGDIALLANGYNLSGKITLPDGTLPSSDDIAKLLAIDNISKSIYRGQIGKISVAAVDSVESYVFYGLPSAIRVDIKAVNSNGRITTLKSSHEIPAQNSTLDLTYTVSAPELKASFISKDPQVNKITAQFDCTQAYRNSSDDTNANGVADTEEFNTFVTVTTGAGSLAFDSVTADRYRSTYIYTIGNGDGTTYSSLVLDADFTTDTTNPKTGKPFEADGVFSHPFGLSAQRTDTLGVDGGRITLPGGAEFVMPEGGLILGNGVDSAEIGLREADSLGSVSEQLSLSGISNRSSGMGVMAVAKKLGAKAYPSGMYKAIKALASTPDVNPFSSFYDIFLPAGVSHVFDRNNKPTLTLKYDDDANPNTINVYYFNEAQGVYTIENVDRRVDLANHTISVTIGHASIFTVLASSASIIQGDAYSGELVVFNFPNPFDLNTKVVTLQNPGSVSASQNIQGTMIKISVPSSMGGTEKIEIYNMAGELVRTINPALTSGVYNYVNWDGTNDHGAKVASGVYIGHLKVGSEKRLFKMAVVK